MSKMFLKDFDIAGPLSMAVKYSDSVFFLKYFPRQCKF